MRSTVFENDEDVAGWKAGSSVAYCKSCFEEKMTKEMNHKDVGHKEDFQRQASGRIIQEAGQSTKRNCIRSRLLLPSLIAHARTTSSSFPQFVFPAFFSCSLFQLSSTQLGSTFESTVKLNDLGRPKLVSAFGTSKVRRLNRLTKCCSVNPSNKNVSFKC